MTDISDLRRQVAEAVATPRPDRLGQVSASGLRAAFNDRVGSEFRIEAPAEAEWRITLTDAAPTSRVRAGVVAHPAYAVAAVGRELRNQDGPMRMSTGDYQRAPLYDDYSRGNLLLLRPTVGELYFDQEPIESLSARAVDRLANLLPSSAKDLAAAGLILGARMPSRRAVLEVSRAAKLARGLTFEYRGPHATVKSVVTVEQATEFDDVLSDLDSQVTTHRFRGVLDGARSARRQFFLDTEGGPDIVGVIDEPLVAAVFASLRKQVQVTVEQTTRSNLAGERPRRAYRLVALAELPENSELDW